MKSPARQANPLLVAIVSLLVSSCQTIDGQQHQEQEGGYGCPEDEYFDGVVDQCQKCKNVCQPLTNPPLFCTINCPEYQRKALLQWIKDKEDRTTTNSHEPSQHATPAAGHILAAAETQLLQHPLLWLSVSCLMVAVMATLAIVVLLVACRRPMQREDVLLSGGNQSSRSYSRSTSSESSAGGDQEKKGLVRPDVASV